MANNTGIDRGPIDTAVKDLRELITDEHIEDFEALKEFKLNAGPPGMDAAQWIADVTVDRRHGLIQHVRNLQFVFEGLADTLTNVADAIQATDSDAAADLDNGTGTVDAINDWIVSVKNVELAPAEGGGHFREGKSTYESGDTSNPLGEKTFFDVDATGKPVVDTDGAVVMNLPLPGDKDDLPNQQLFDDYTKNMKDLADTTTGDGVVHEDFIMSDQHQKILESDPEDEGAGSSNSDGLPQTPGVGKGPDPDSNPLGSDNFGYVV